MALKSAAGAVPLPSTEAALAAGEDRAEVVDPKRSMKDQT